MVKYEDKKEESGWIRKETPGKKFGINKNHNNFDEPTYQLETEGENVEIKRENIKKKSEKK